MDDNKYKKEIWSEKRFSQASNSPHFTSFQFISGRFISSHSSCIFTFANQTFVLIPLEWFVLLLVDSFHWFLEPNCQILNPFFVYNYPSSQIVKIAKLCPDHLISWNAIIFTMKSTIRSEQFWKNKYCWEKEWKDNSVFNELVFFSFTGHG